ncbi:YMGG-like glycine zipper-containing protein [Enterobacteriaceae bacterium ESL0689]|nr:YMGG-like glycine zipper-containing protein [Enterobacteriaceae bacterium ESL0689]
MMIIHRRNILCVLISATLFLSGCVDTGSSLLNKADTRLTSGEQAKFFSSSGAEGCGVGALLGAGVGALVGALAGDDSSDVVTGAVVGGAAGCATGMATNYYLDSVQKNYATTSDRLNGMERGIREETAAVKKTASVMNQVIRDNRATLSRISQQKDKAGFNTASARKELAKIDANIKVMKDKISMMKEQDAGFKNALKNQRTTTKAEKEKLASMNQQYNDLNSQIAALENEANGLFAQRKALSLG